MVTLPFAVYALIFIIAPMLLVVFYSVSDPSSGLTLEHYIRFFDPANPVYLNVLWRSVYLALISTLICLVLGYPLAYILAGMKPGTRNFLSFLFVLPMWMNFLLRTYAWMTLLERTGVINSLLAQLGLPAWNIMYTESAVILGMVYNFLPFMILPIYNMLIKLDKSLIESASDLGANKVQTFLRVELPLTMPGIYSGITMTFMPAVTTFIISKLLGGGQNALIGDLIEKQFKVVGDWGFGSAMSVILMILILFFMWISSKYEKDHAEGGGLL